MKAVYLALLCLSLRMLVESQLVSKCLQPKDKEYFSTMLIQVEMHEISIVEFTEEYHPYIQSQTDDFFTCLQLATSDSPIWKAGATVLLSTNCAKDVGGTLMVLDALVDSVKSKDAKNAIVQGVMTAMLGVATFRDCSAAYNQIREIWSN